ALAEEITVSPADVMRAVGTVLDARNDLDPLRGAELRIDLAEALSRAPARVEAVVVVRHAGLPEMAWVEGRDRWAHELIATAEQELCRLANMDTMGALRSLDDRALVAALWRAAPPLPVDAEFPLFVIYTSGSTGKPKGVVHVHGGYVAGVAHTMAVSFDAVPGRDVIYVVADPGWITGQSYLITASLACRIPGIVTEGAPVFPHAGRFASIIERHKVTIFKAGVTFLKAVMANPQNRADVQRYDVSSLKVATFCAEPTSPAVQSFGMELMTPQYINSYWATEHGGIVWTHPYGNADQRLKADAHTFPLPWVLGDVWLPTGEADADGRVPYRSAGIGEKGEIVVARPYPYLARTIWGDAANVGKSGWKGDFARYVRTYFGRFKDAAGAPVWAYLQGDFARKYADGSFSLHGRSDDVINVSGHRLGTEEIEGAILRDKQLNPDSPVGNCIVIGAPHREKGLTPVAFILPAPKRSLSGDDERRLKELVRAEKGAVAVPSDFVVVNAFPETRSGKYMRRFLKAMMLDEPLGDTSTLRNPECLPEIAERIRSWKAAQDRTDRQTLFETMRFVRVQYDTVGDGALVATVTIANPPVNALSERVLDELGTVVTHLARRDEVKAVVVTGAGRAFVAGADVRQLLEQVQDIGQARALPAKAHAVFSAIEALRKPVIAAIKGFALGGGCEFALACHVRVGNARTRFGQPEINLFLPPGFGGTQRLPRLLAAARPRTGLTAALAMLLSGRQVGGEEAHRLGLIDRLAAGAEEPFTLAQSLAREAALTGKGVAIGAMRRRHERLAEWRKPATMPEAAATNAYIRRCLAQAERVGRGAVAARILDLVRIGLTQGFAAGLAAEIEAFAAFLLDAEHGGRKGIRLFLDKKSPPLPARPRPAPTLKRIAALQRQGALLPIGAPFFPGVTPLPTWQFAQAVVRDARTGAYNHAGPAEAEVEAIVPVPRPGPTQALLYVLASEVNYNDLWAITGIPVSLFDEHDEDVHVTGSGGIALVAALGEELQAEGRLAVGDLVNVYSGQSDLMDPEAGREPMFTRFQIQGYQTPDGSHQQFMLADGPQCQKPPPDLTLEQAGSYVLAAGTAYRALFSTLQIQGGKSLLTEGAATGTGAIALRMALATRLKGIGIVSSSARQAAIRAWGAGAIDRADPVLAACFTRVPADPVCWADWERAGEAFLARVRAANDGRLVDYAVSHAGETALPRSFQALAPGGKLTFYGASSGYQMTFIGKAGGTAPEAMLARANLRPGDAVVVFYGAGAETRDRTALGAIEAARAAGGRIVVVTDDDGRRDFVLSLGFGDAVLGAVSLAEIRRRVPQFLWPDTMPDLPDPQRETAAFKEAVRRFTEFTFKPLGDAVGRLFRSADNPRGVPDLVVERAGCDSLFVSTMLVKPNGGAVLYCGDMGGRRYSFYAPQVWMRQRRILMPSAEILGTHLCNAAEVAALNRMIAAGLLPIDPPYLAPWRELPAVHQALWENRLPEHAAGAAKAVANHALPEAGLKTRDELYAAWAALTPD
ncbi:MAG TPA: enoyl-CoA hydratase-related protein, partial [Candidatus Sulfotelmatobacter sp.]|nr:enoyl-CoA hydratase-related protein [Candidatus Sulfotelmatobacter sp.]